VAVVPGSPFNYWVNVPPRLGVVASSQ